jgi:hypothetical protein
VSKLTLHRAGRIQEQINARIGRLSFETHAKISIFSTDPEGDVDRRAHGLWKDVERLQRLGAIRTKVRAVLARQNAETGISGLLAEKAGLERQVALLSSLVDQESGEPEGWMTARRRSRHQVSSTKRGQASLVQQIEATRARFAAGDGNGETEMSAPLLDASLEDEVRLRVIECRRRLDEISDRLRTLNSSATVEVADEALDYLREEGVI